MRLEIEAGGDKPALMDLYRFLREDDGVAANSTVSLRPPRDPGEMGALDVIDVVLTHATGLASLALAYAAWRKARPQAPSVTISTRVSITLGKDEPEPAGRIVETFSEQTFGEPVGTEDADG